MPTPNERKGLFFLALVALSGTGVRVWRARMPAPTAIEVATLDRQLGKVDSARSARRETKIRKPKTAKPAVADSQPVDLSSATLAQLDALPGIGPALAKRIVAHRDSAGPFSDMTGFCAVRGVGPALAERLRPLVTFGGRASPVSEVCDPPSTGAGNARAARARKRP